MQLLSDLHVFLWESMVNNNCNTFLINGSARVLIDPGHIKHFHHVQSGLTDLGLTLEDIDLVIITHAHPDHIEAARVFKNTPALIATHDKDWQLVKSMETFIKSFMGINIDDMIPDIFLEQGEFSIKKLKLEIFHTPGHSPGSISIYWPDRKVLFTGDVIFEDSFGRTDLPGGNGSQIKESIKMLSELDVEWMLPGHGPIISDSNSVSANFKNVINSLFEYI